MDSAYRRLQAHISINSRLGTARADFDTLMKVWSHSNLKIERKYEIFQACISSKLLCCLHTTWLRKAEVNKLNAFQSRCIRKLIGVKPSYWSRVSNQTVLQTVGAKPFSQMLLQQQLQYFGDIARRPTGHVLRDMIFQASNTNLVQVPGPRRKGRPRNT